MSPVDKERTVHRIRMILHRRLNTNGNRVEPVPDVFKASGAGVGYLPKVREMDQSSVV
jgi:hypothetical protein